MRIVFTIVFSVAVLTVNAQLFIDKKIPELPGERTIKASVELRGLAISQVRISVVYGLDSIEVVRAFQMNQRNPAKYFESVAAIRSEGNGKAEAIVVLPHEGKPAARRERAFKSGSKVFYAWARTHTPSGASEELTLNSSVKSFLMPRPITIAYLGDSYASGEGAKGSGNWVNSACHRSNNSGGVLAYNKLKEEKTDTEFDFVNATCSGARVLDFFAVSQPVEPGSTKFKQGKQVDIVAQWLSSKSYDGLDILLADGGGNDIGFGNIVAGGLTSFFKELRNDQELLNFVNTSLESLPDTYQLFMDYTNNAISPQKVIWFNYPNPMTGEDRSLCKQDNLRAANPLDCWGILENQISNEDWRFMYQNVFVKLNNAVEAAAQAHGWELVDISDKAIGKGVCNCEGYFNTYGQSKDAQDDEFGTFHPNVTGFRVIYRDAIYNSLLKNVNTLLNDDAAARKALAIAKAKKKAKAAAALKLSMAKQTQLVQQQNKLISKLSLIKPEKTLKGIKSKEK